MPEFKNQNESAESQNELSKVEDAARKNPEAGKVFDEKQDKAQGLGRGDNEFSEKEIAASKDILAFAKENNPTDKLKFKNIIKEKFGYDIDKNGDGRIDPSETVENRKFFISLLNDIHKYYKNNGSKSKTVDEEKQLLQREKEVLDIAKVYLLLMGISANNPNKNLEDAKGNSNYSIIEKALVMEASSLETNVIIETLQQEADKKEITDNGYTLLNTGRPYKISKSGTKMTPEEKKTFENSFFNIAEKISDKRELQQPIHEQYNLPENIISTQEMNDLPGFKELREKIQNPNMKVKEINIIGMASFIPTDLNQQIFSYMDSKGKRRPSSRDENNTYLSEARALIANDWAENVLKENNYDIATVKITSSNKVDGPSRDAKYNDPTLRQEREGIYQPYQGVDFNVVYEQKKDEYNYVLDKNAEGRQDDMPFRLTTEVVVPQSLLAANKIVVKDNQGQELKSEYILLQLSSNAKSTGDANHNRNFSTISPTTAMLKMKNAINKDIKTEQDIEVNVMKKGQGENVKNTPVLLVNQLETFNEINNGLIKNDFTDNQAARIMKRLLKEQAKSGGFSSS